MALTSIMRLGFAGIACAFLFACSAAPPPPPRPLPTVATDPAETAYQRRCRQVVAELARPVPRLTTSRLEVWVPGDHAITTAVARGYRNNPAAAAEMEQTLRDRVDCVVDLIMNSGLVNQIRLVRYARQPDTSSAVSPQIVVSGRVLRESLHLSWRYRTSVGDTEPLLFQAADSGPPDLAEARALVTHLDRLSGGWRPPDFDVPADRLAYCDRGNPCAPVWTGF